MSDAVSQIHIHELEVRARVGVTDNERDVRQRLVLNVTLSPRISFDALNDEIAATVNYSAVAAEIRNFAEASAFNLIETLASNIATRLLEAFPVSEVRVEVRKFVLPRAEYVSVTTSRAANG